MKIKATCLAASFILATAMSAHAGEISISKYVDVDAPLEDVWNVANEFCSIKIWGGTFSDCTQEMKDGVVWRTLTIKDGGGEVREKLTDVSDTSYSYAIIQAPLPLENHEGKIWVEDGTDSMTRVRWDVSFDVKQEGDVRETTDAIEGILSTGLDSIKKIAESDAAH